MKEHVKDIECEVGRKNTGWNGRKRMHIAMSRKRPDRVPTMPQICYPHAVSLLYEDYRKGIAEVLEHPEKSLELILEVGKRYGVDGLRLFVPPAPVRVKDDGDVMAAFNPETGEYVGRVDALGGGKIITDNLSFPVESPDDINRIPRPDCEEFLGTEFFILLKKATERAHDDGFFVASSPGSFTITHLSERRGKEQAFQDILINKDLAKQIMDAGLEVAIESARALVKCGVDALYVGDPFSSLISPKTFEEFCLPVFRIFCDELHKENVLIYIHICGNSSQILEMMAETGADCIEPLDPLGGVRVEDAKRRVGGRVSLMGGVNTLTLLNGSPELVYEESLSCCRAGAENGGYILAAGDMIPNFTPEENLKALINATRDFSRQHIQGEIQE